MLNKHTYFVYVYDKKENRLSILLIFLNHVVHLMLTDIII